MSRQMYLFADTVVPDANMGLSQSDFRLLTWNLQAPSIDRARRQAEWLATVRANLLILTEATYSEGSFHVISEIESRGFQVFFAEPRDQKFSTAICVRGTVAKTMEVTESTVFPRARVLSVQTFLGELHVVGVYGPSSWGDMPLDKLENRKLFQRQILHDLKAKGKLTHVIVGGDLNVVDPGNGPEVPGFEDHSFYNGLLQTGLSDAYRLLHPQTNEHSWVSSTGLGLRLDHFFVSHDIEAQIAECAYDHNPRRARLSDHSAMLLTMGKRQ